MRVITEYQCEVCGERYTDKQNALTCESKGIFTPTVYPKGLMFEYHHNGYVGIFTLATISSYSRDRHLGEYTHWACRDRTNYPADSIGEERCSGGFLHSDTEYINRWLGSKEVTKEKTKSPEFARMVAFLKSGNITPSYYNEQRELITL